MREGKLQLRISFTLELENPHLHQKLLDKKDEKLYIPLANDGSQRRYEDVNVR